MRSGHPEDDVVALRSSLADAEEQVSNDGFRPFFLPSVVWRQSHELFPAFFSILDS